MEDFARRECSEQVINVDYQSLVSEVFGLIKKCNQQFQLLCKKCNITEGVLLREDFEIASALTKLPAGEDDFWNQTASLAKLFDISANSMREFVRQEAAKRHINLENLTKRIFSGDSFENLGTIKLLKILATITNDSRYEHVFKIWSAIRRLRHLRAHILEGKSLKEVAEALETFGENYPPRNYLNLWTKVIQELKASLEMMSELLKELQK